MTKKHKLKLIKSYEDNIMLDASILEALLECRKKDNEIINIYKSICDAIKSNIRLQNLDFNKFGFYNQYDSFIVNIYNDNFNLHVHSNIFKNIELYKKNKKYFNSFNYFNRHTNDIYAEVCYINNVLVDCYSVHRLADELYINYDDSYMKNTTTHGHYLKSDIESIIRLFDNNEQISYANDLFYEMMFYNCDNNQHEYNTLIKLKELKRVLEYIKKIKDIELLNSMLSIYNYNLDDFIIDSEISINSFEEKIKITNVMFKTHHELFDKY